MSYRLKSGESVRDGLRRCSREQLDRAVHELTEAIKAEPVEAIHDARKALKKQRSLLRLARAAFPAGERRQEAALLREAARRLSGTRDADVMISALDDLSERFADTIPAESITAARADLVAQRNRERERAMRSGTATAVTIELRAVRAHVDEWQLRGGGWSAIGDGLDRSYRRGRAAFKLARAEPTPENLHDWRKRVKDFWYHLRLLKPVSEPTMSGQAEEAHRLSELLGDDHDLWVLREALIEMETEMEREVQGEIPAPVDLDPLLGAIDQRRAQLESAAMLLGARVYAEKPKAFRRRIHHYWRAWRAETKAGASAAAVGSSE
jgi:CHAD domain-containing protein